MTFRLLSIRCKESSQEIQVERWNFQPIHQIHFEKLLLSFYAKLSVTLVINEIVRKVWLNLPPFLSSNLKRWGPLSFKSFPYNLKRSCKLHESQVFYLQLAMNCSTAVLIIIKGKKYFKHEFPWIIWKTNT